MKNLLGGNNNENIYGLGASFLGLALLVFSLWREPVFITFDLILAVALTGAIVLAGLYPIHIRYATKVSLTSVPLFLCAALLPRPIAMLCGGVGILLTAWMTRKKFKLLPIDFLVSSCRWMIILFLVNSFSHLAPSYPLDDVLLIPTAFVMFCMDIITFSIFSSLTTSEPVLILVRSNIAEVYAIEGIQYFIGILGSVVYERAPWFLILFLAPLIIIYQTFKSLKEMNRGTREILINMADTIDLRDPYTGGHSRRVAEFTRLILREMNISGAEADLIETSAYLHDIGKIAIPDAVLLKPSRLTPDEWKIMQSHPEKSNVLLSRYPDFKRGAAMVLSHHEHWDGKGYPRGLKEFLIPLGARIIAVADAFDAMITDRPYRPARTVEQAIVILHSGRGGQWDPEVVDHLVSAIIANPPEVPPNPFADKS